MNPGSWGCLVPTLVLSWAVAGGVTPGSTPRHPTPLPRPALQQPSPRPWRGRHVLARLLVEAKDATFNKITPVGVSTEADAKTSFDDFAYRSP